MTESKDMISAEDSPQPSKNAAVWTKGRIRWLWQTVPTVFVLIGLIAWMSITEFQQKSLLRQYQASPNCTSNPHTLKNLSPCTRAPMQITEKRYNHNSKSRDDYYLTLRPPIGGTKEVSLLGHNLWDRAKIGDTVTAKSWRGKIVLVSGYGYSPVTEDYPEADSFRNNYCLAIFIIGLLLMPFVIAKGWREQGVITDAKDNSIKAE